MSTILPTRTDLRHYEFEITLDGSTYRLTFRWGEREAAWFFSVSEEDGTPISTNVKVVINFPLARRNAKRRPPGMFLAIDTSGTGTEARIDDLGRRVALHYFAEDELG